MLVDQNLKAWLLEVNDNPSLYIYLEKDYMGGGVEKEISRVDLEVKSAVVGDAILLAKKSERVDQFRTYSRLTGVDEGESSHVVGHMMRLVNLFNELTPIKDKKHLSG